MAPFGGGYEHDNLNVNYDHSQIPNLPSSNSYPLAGKIQGKISTHTIFQQVKIWDKKYYF
jgi:hypothetical protein